MQVGGRDFSYTKEQVEAKMRGVEPESPQKYVVAVGGVDYPPKQVLAHVTGWVRTSFTTMEAQRVLTRIGLRSRHAGTPADTVAPHDIDSKIAELEATLNTAQALLSDLRGLMLDTVPEVNAAAL